jgi:hypothetical protein
MSKHNVSRVTRQRTTADVYDIRTGAAVARTAEEIRAAFLRTHAHADVPYRIRAIAAVMAKKGLSDSAKCLFVVRQLFADRDTGKNSTPSQETLAAILHKKARQIRNLETELASAFLVQRVRRQQKTVAVTMITAGALDRIISEIIAPERQEVACQEYPDRQFSVVQTGKKLPTTPFTNPSATALLNRPTNRAEKPHGLGMPFQISEYDSGQERKGPPDGVTLDECAKLASVLNRWSAEGTEHTADDAAELIRTASATIPEHAAPHAAAAVCAQIEKMRLKPDPRRNGGAATYFTTGLLAEAMKIRRAVETDTAEQALADIAQAHRHKRNVEADERFAQHRDAAMDAAFANMEAARASRTKKGERNPTEVESVCDLVSENISEWGEGANCVLSSFVRPLLEYFSNTKSYARMPDRVAYATTICDYLSRYNAAVLGELYHAHTDEYDTELPDMSRLRQCAFDIAARHARESAAS